MIFTFLVKISDQPFFTTPFPNLILEFDLVVVALIVGALIRVPIENLLLSLLQIYLGSPFLSSLFLLKIIDQRYWQDLVLS
jgi:hypothetical protein